jgi:hypothetical protein
LRIADFEAASDDVSLIIYQFKKRKNQKQCNSYLKWRNLFSQDEQVLDVEQLTVDQSFLAGNEMRGRLH